MILLKQQMNLLVAQMCQTLWDPVDCSPPSFSVHGIFQARIMKWVAIPFSKESSWPRNRTQASCTAGKFFTIWATRETWWNYWGIILKFLRHSWANKWCFPVNCIYSLAQVQHYFKFLLEKQLQLLYTIHTNTKNYFKNINNILLKLTPWLVLIYQVLICV